MLKERKIIKPEEQMVDATVYPGRNDKKKMGFR